MQYTVTTFKLYEETYSIHASTKEEAKAKVLNGEGILINEGCRDKPIINKTQVSLDKSAEVIKENLYIEFLKNKAKEKKKPITYQTQHDKHDEHDDNDNHNHDGEPQP